MCGDLNDPDNPQRAAAASYFSPSFQFDAAQAVSSPSTTVTGTTVSELVVTPPRPPPVEVTDVGVLTVEQVVAITPVVPNGALITIPPLDNLSVPVKPTPCVQRLPLNADIDALNASMYFLAAQCLSNAITDGNEWGGFVYLAPDGGLHQTLPFSSGDPDKLNNVNVAIPGTSIVVGYVHTHPPGAGQTTPSPNTQGAGNDEDFINHLAGMQAGDDNMIAYVANLDSNGQAHFYAYDRNHLHNPSTGCQLIQQ